MFTPEIGPAELDLLASTLADEIIRLPDSERPAQTARA
jgi:hypothetical protein